MSSRRGGHALLAAMSWWCVGGFGATFVVAVLLADLISPAAALLGWGPVIGTVVRDRLRSGEAHRRPARSRRTEPAFAVIFAVLLLGLGMLPQNLLGEVRPLPAVVDGCVLALGALGLTLLAPVLRRDRASPPA